MPLINNVDGLLANIVGLLEKKETSDVTIICNGKEYACHRVILGASSEVFQAMLNGNWCESGSMKVELNEPDECAAVFPDFIKYFYCGRVDVSVDNAFPILLLADKYIVDKLDTAIKKFMSDNFAEAMISGHISSWMEISQNRGDKTFLNMCEKFLLRNLILLNPDGPYTLKSSVLFSLLRRSDLIVYDEASLYRFVVRWLLVREPLLESENEMEALVKEAMSYIRFCRMEPSQLEELLFCGMVKRYQDFFAEKIRDGFGFIKGKEDRIQEILSRPYGHLQMTSRLYVQSPYVTPIVIQSFSRERLFSKSEFRIFSPKTSSDDDAEWLVQFYPRGVYIEKCVLALHRLALPEHFNKTVRMTFRKEKPPEEELRVRIAVVIHGTQNKVSCLVDSYEKIHYFSADDDRLVIDDIFPYDEFNPSMDPLCPPAPASAKYVNDDTLKMIIIIEPMPLITR